MKVRSPPAPQPLGNACNVCSRYNKAPHGTLIHTMTGTARPAPLTNPMHCFCPVHTADHLSSRVSRSCAMQSYAMFILTIGCDQRSLMASVKRFVRKDMPLRLLVAQPGTIHHVASSGTSLANSFNYIGRSLFFSSKVLGVVAPYSSG